MFKKPTFEEVQQYCLERRNGIDPQRFIDSNDSTGWVVGKLCKPMKDWKATIRTWEANDRKWRKEANSRAPILTRLTDRSWAE